jgi:hypothetical protein
MRTALLITDAYLVGLAFVVGIVVYPAFRSVGLHEWSEYHGQHSSAITVAVGPAWLAQGVLCAAWILNGPQRAIALAHGLFALLGVVVTIFGAVPQHNAIATQRTLTHLRKLELWHWIRTLAWIAALLCVVAL